MPFLRCQHPTRAMLVGRECPPATTRYQNRRAPPGKEAQGEGLCALKGFRMKIFATLLLEMNAEGIAVEFATLGRLADNWTKACDEQNLDLASACIVRPLLKTRPQWTPSPLLDGRRPMPHPSGASPTSPRSCSTVMGFPSPALARTRAARSRSALRGDRKR